MVQVCLQFLDADGAEIQQVRPNAQAILTPNQGSCKTTMLGYKSEFFSLLSTLYKLPMYLLSLGSSESQVLEVVVHDDFEV